jgi:hypothetical protein
MWGTGVAINDREAVNWNGNQSIKDMPIRIAKRLSKEPK